MTSIDTQTVKEVEEWIKKPNNVEIYTKTWSPSGKVIATVTFVHGLGEHINRYNHVFPVFAQKGIKVYGFDQRGFGKTVRRYGTIGNSEGLDTVMADIGDACKAVKQDGVPHFIFGHSMGGMLALRYAAFNPKDVVGVVLSGPCIRPGKKTAPNIVEVQLLKFLPYIVPSLSMKSTVGKRIELTLNATTYANWRQCIIQTRRISVETLKS